MTPSSQRPSPLRPADPLQLRPDPLPPPRHSRRDARLRSNQTRRRARDWRRDRAPVRADQTGQAGHVGPSQKWGKVEADGRRDGVPEAGWNLRNKGEIAVYK